jgi:hypothetical protein
MTRVERRTAARVPARLAADVRLAEALVAAVREVGAERLLFGSDTPLYHVAMQRARIQAAEIPEAAKVLILRDNAWKFFNLSRCASLNPVLTRV